MNNKLVVITHTSPERGGGPPPQTVVEGSDYQYLCSFTKNFKFTQL